MRTKSGLTFFMVVFLISPALPQTGQTPEAMLGAALHQERVIGKLQDAIDGYRKVLAIKGVPRSVAAQAQYHIGVCYEKLGNQESRRAFESVVRNYADQKDVVAQARARLAALGSGKPAGRQTTTVAWSSPKVYPFGDSVSPDGRYISFTDWDTGNLTLHDLADGTDRALTTTGNFKEGTYAYADYTALSRDGKQVAYGWDEAKTKGYDLRLANVIGNPDPRRLYNDPKGRTVLPSDWSPDGKWIAVQLGDKQTAQVCLIGTQDGSLRVLKSIGRGLLPGALSNYGKIVFSPDGKYLAYDRPASETQSQRDVFVLAIGEDREIPVAAGPSQERLVGWSPDSKRLLFISNRTGANGLWAVSFANGAPSGPPELLKPDIGGIAAVGVSAAGALYYCVPKSRDLPRFQIETFDFATWKQLSPPITLAEGTAEGISFPDWSPDGKQLAYVSERFGPIDSEALIKIRTIETGQVRELQPQLGSLNWLRWSPDGRSLIVQDYAYRTLYRIDAQSGERSLLLPRQQGRSFENPVLSPDGKTLYYRRADKESVTFGSLDLAAGVEREIVRSSRMGLLNLSPDAAQIATWMVNPSDDSERLMVYPVLGGNPRELMRQPRKGGSMAEPDGAGWTLSFLAWAPDSRSVFVRRRASSDSQEVELWRASLDGTEPHQIVAKLDPVMADAAIRLHPDGRRFTRAFRATTSPQQQPTSQIVVLENFLPAQNPSSGNANLGSR
ncbi:MAG TPA: hypothetical protein VKB88_20050 [Bryobacteraceae bacterium]|nr:hypothetical protein [Bryobacteraceae bacterium]